MRIIAAFLLYLPLLLPSTLHSQTRAADNWFFGLNYGLNFSAGEPQIVRGGALNAAEAAAAYSDPCTGELQIYTDGATIWDRQHGVVPDAAGVTELTGLITESTSQAAVILPHPNKPNLLYVINPGNLSSDLTIGQNQFSRNFYYHLGYHLVDMSARDGLGMIIERNVLGLDLHLSEKITATYDAARNEYIVVSKTKDSGQFCLWRIDRDGLETEATVLDVPGEKYESLFGYIRFSPDATMLAEADSWDWNAPLRLWKFDVNSMTFSDPIVLHSPQLSQYGLSFSPDSRFLFTSGKDAGLQQFRLDDYNAGAIARSRYVIDTQPDIPYSQAALQLGPDGRIYMLRENRILSRIENPNEYGAALKYDRNFLVLTAADEDQFAIALPNFPDYMFNPDYTFELPIQVSAETREICSGKPFSLRASGADNYSWSPGHLLNDSTIANPSARITENTCFTVTTERAACRGSAEICIKLAAKTPELAVRPDTTICAGDSLQLFANSDENVEWEAHSSLDNPQSSAPVVRPVSTTLYRVRAGSGS